MKSRGKPKTRYPLSKAEARKHPSFACCGRLFEYCWKKTLRLFSSGATDDPKTVEEMLGWLKSVASETVNNPRSGFYIYGK